MSRFKMFALSLLCLCGCFAISHALATTDVKPMGSYVGELQERWTFPSDHIPIGMTYNGIHMMSWNVLDSHAMDWVTENSQGLKRSQITQLNVPVDGRGLTLRDQRVVELLTQAINHPTHPKSLVYLQECSQAFLEELDKVLPSHWFGIRHNGNAIIGDSNVFEVTQDDAIRGIFSEAPRKTVQEVVVKRVDNGEVIRLVNAHLPGNPEGPARFEFAQYLANTFEQEMITIAAGDMNFNEAEMTESLKEIFCIFAGAMKVHAPYCTNISPYTFFSKCIDHFIVNADVEITLNEPEEVMIGLGAYVDLLSP